MEIHRNYLQKLCRVCARPVKLGRGYVNAKEVTNYIAVFNNVYNVAVESESPDIYPKKLCSTCKKKLAELTKEGNMSVKYECYNFVSHVDINCPICYKSSIVVKSKSFHLRKFDINENMTFFDFHPNKLKYYITFYYYIALKIM